MCQPVLRYVEFLVNESNIMKSHKICMRQSIKVKCLEEPLGYIQYKSHNEMFLHRYMKISFTEICKKTSSPLRNQQKSPSLRNL